MTADPYAHYQHFCEMLAVTPAPREVYERINNKVYPIDLAVYSVPFKSTQSLQTATCYSNSTKDWEIKS